MRISDWSSDVCSSDLRWREQASQFATMLDTRGIGREPAVFQEREKPQLATNLGELSIIADGDDEVTVLGGKCLIRRNVGMCVAEATDRKSTRLNSSH